MIYLYIYISLSLYVHLHTHIYILVYIYIYIANGFTNQLTSGGAPSWILQFLHRPCRSPAPRTPRTPRPRALTTTPTPTATAPRRRRQPSRWRLRHQVGCCREFSSSWGERTDKGRQVGRLAILHHLNTSLLVFTRGF